MKSTGPSLAVRQLVIDRSARACLRCNAPGVQIHHRRPRKAGGTSRPEINSPENLVFLCLNCHTWAEQNRTAAEATGWLVREGIDGPLEVPLVGVRGERFFLDEEGGIVTPWRAA